MIALPNLLRDSTLLIGREPYYYMRLAETPSGFDGLSYSGRTLVFNLYPYILGAFSGVVGITTFSASKILPFVLGLISVVLFYIILKKLRISIRDSLLTCLVLVFSPTFIYLFSTSNLYIFPVLSGLIAFLFILADKKIWAGFFILLSFFFGIIPGITLTILYFVYIFRNKKIRWLIIPLAVLVSIILYLIKGFLPFGLDFFIQQEGIKYAYQNLISDFGGKFGLGIFGLILAFLGLVKLWKKKYSNMIFYSVVFLMLILCFFEIKTLFYLIFVFSFLVVLGIIYLFELNFQSKFIKDFSIFVLILGVFFSGVSYVNELRHSLPDTDLIRGFDGMETLSNPEDVFFSHYSRGFWIEGMANRKVVMDEDFILAPDIDERYKDSEDLLKTRDIDLALKILNKYNVKYILFDKAIKETLWEGDEEGLLFLLKYSEKFKKVYNSNGIEVWEVI